MKASPSPRQLYLMKLSKLHSSFPTYATQEAQRKVNTVSEEAAKQIRGGDRALRHVNSAGDVNANISYYNKAIKRFEAAAALIVTHKVNPNVVSIFETETYQKIGDCYIGLSKITTDINQQHEYLEHAVPGIHDKTTAARIARAMAGSTSLNLAFDFSQGLYAAVTLSEQQYKDHLRLGIYLTNNLIY